MSDHVGLRALVEVMKRRIALLPLRTMHALGFWHCMHGGTCCQCKPTKVDWEALFGVAGVPEDKATQGWEVPTYERVEEWLILAWLEKTHGKRYYRIRVESGQGYASMAESKALTDHILAALQRPWREAALVEALRRQKQRIDGDGEWCWCSAEWVKFNGADVHSDHCLIAKAALRDAGQ